MTPRTQIRNALMELLNNPKCILIGEDIRDDYGGVAKITRGLTKLFDKQIINTPISEAGIIGIATGMTLEGFRPIVEIMFYDFTTLIVDQIINHALKFKELWNIDVPILIRTMIGDKNYGKTHSQDLDYLWKNIPGVTVIHPTPGDDYYKLLIQAYALPGIKIFVENRLEYD